MGVQSRASDRVPTTRIRFDPGVMMSAEDPGSITRWLEGLKAGRPEAAEAIWERYYARVVAMAQCRLRLGPHQAVEDGEDVALSALNGLYAGAAQGRFERLDDRSDLWQVLAAITVKKAIHRRRWYNRWKRAGRPSPLASASSAGILRVNPSDEAGLLARAVSKEPIPEISVILHEQLERLLDALTDPTLRQIADWRLEGIPNAEIAQRLGRAVRTVERKLELIRLIWETMGDDGDR
jgi:DNA-directed RNA polymerase specialized sigma24 family protein